MKPSFSSEDPNGIELFWDRGKFYADIVIENSGKFSFFSRNRHTGLEVFLENKHIDNLNDDWFNTYLIKEEQ